MDRVIPIVGENYTIVGELCKSKTYNDSGVYNKK